MPRRAMVRVMPNAMASSLPVNQRAMMALWATIMDSEPMPNRTRPASRTAKLGAQATMAAPATTKPEKIRLARRTPTRSIRTPPTPTATTAATLYIMYMVPMAARSVWNT